MLRRAAAGCRGMCGPAFERQGSNAVSRSCEFQMPTDPGPRLADAVVGPETGFFVFDRVLEPADRNAFAAQQIAHIGCPRTGSRDAARRSVARRQIGRRHPKIGDLTLENDLLAGS